MRLVHHHQQEDELLQQQQQQELQQQQQELQRQRILSLFESSPPPPDHPEDHLLDLQPPPSFDANVPPRPHDPPQPGGPAMLDFSDRCGTPVVGVNARVDVQVRKRRGRPPRLNGAAGAIVSSTVVRREDEEEDVCFICFDGGTLVLCDRRGCPKAYHPACIKRDESFFQSKAKWNCGWHICSSCQKASYYMCYTCTYSLCKNCTRGADYVCVRGTKGLCGICMKTIMLIESVEHRNKEMVQVDFDDKLSWEYLFKIYWICLKEKLSLTFQELTSAKNPWKDPGSLFHESIGGPQVLNTNNWEIHGLGIFTNQVGNDLNGMKGKQEQFFRNEVESRIHLPCGQSSDGSDWASKELLEFVSHMKNGDTSVLSHFDVEALLLEYVKRNNLRDPQRKCQIICDSRLFSLFGKGVVGHFEMLKLLDYHVLVKVDPRVHRGLQGAVTDVDVPLMENGTSSQNHHILGRDKGRRNCKRIVQNVHSINQGDQAAIDVHNINLIYLRRDLVEKLVKDYGSFHEKAAGCFVRIKISSDDPKQEIYRLVQIIGKSELDEPNMTDGGISISKVTLEISDADKKEFIPINEISNQEFSEDECKRLRESIQSGLTKSLSLGDIQKKAMALHAIKINYWLEMEITRLNCLRDRASEKGHLKELRECVEKLQLLCSPQERQRRLNDLPEVHKDPSMDPEYKSLGTHRTLSRSPVGRKRKASNPLETGGFVLRETRSRTRRKWATNLDQDTKIPVTTGVHRGSSDPTFEMTGSVRVQAQEVSAISSSMTEITGGQAIAVIAGERYNNESIGSTSHSVVVSEITPSPLSTGTDQSVNDIEVYKIWHYRDPQGRVQGPFTLLQLRKWNLNGHFPIDLVIWRTYECYEDSILLTEALSGRHTRHQALGLKEGDNKQDSLISECMDTSMDEGSCALKKTGSSSPSKSDNEVVMHNGLAEPSSCRTSAVDDVKVASTEEQTKSILSIMLDFAISGDASFVPDKPGDSMQLPEEAPASCVKSQLLSPQEKASDTDRQKEQVDNISISDQLSGQNWVNELSVRNTVNDNGSNGPNVRQEELETSTQKTGDFSGPMSEIGKEELKTHIGKNMQSSANNPAQDTANPSWSTSTSSLVAGDPPPLPPDEATGEWVVYSAAPSNGWESGLVSVPSFRSDEISNNHTSATNSGSARLIHSAPQSIPDTTWQAPDFNALGEESVSDLLAEVEAMESMSWLPSPTSKLKYPPDLAVEHGKDDCFSAVDGFSLPPSDPGKGETFATTSRTEVPPQPVIAKIPHTSSPDNPGLNDDQRKSVTSATLHRPMPHGTNWNVNPIAGNFVSGSMQADASWGAVQGNRHTSYEGTNHGNPTTDWDIRHGMAPGNGNVCYGSVAGSPSQTVWSNQPRFSNSSGHRYPGSRAYLGADVVGFNRNRSSAWIKQYSGGGSGSFQEARGQRVCKFHEAGYCKKGASCGYSHQ